MARQLHGSWRAIGYRIAAKHRKIMHPQATAPATGQKILVADDDEDIRLLISSTLSRAGFKVSAVADGEAAWEEMQTTHCDLLITDNEMPRLEGLQLIKRMRAAGIKMPVIMISGTFAFTSVPDYAELQVAAVVAKPFKLWELLAMVQIALSLPARNTTAKANLAAGLPAPKAIAPASVVRLRPKQVLIADDDSGVRESLAAVLQSEGYRVDEASDGIEAVTRAISHKPDLVLLDLNLPHTDGWTAFSQLEQIKPLLPVIIITARPNQYKEAVRVGVDAFMEKPLNIPMLVKAVKRLTNEDEHRHENCHTKRTFVTQLLGSPESSRPTW